MMEDLLRQNYDYKSSLQIPPQNRCMYLDALVVDN